MSSPGFAQSLAEHSEAVAHPKRLFSQETVIDEVKDPANRVLYTGALREDALMPTEFSTAAYRLFHSRARGRYRLNNETDGSDSTRPRARLFDVGNDEPILTGGTPMENLFVIEWDRFFGETVSFRSVAQS
eukprot:scaffold189_cov249-Pinguiococcus_pyrenoidosus.AAC.25